MTAIVDELAGMALSAADGGDGRATTLITIDGPAGSGKTQLAAAVADVLGSAVIHMDDLYEGWSGLDDQLAGRLGAWVVTPLQAGLPVRHLVYDWHRGAFARWREVAATAEVILEGVGAGQTVTATSPVTGLRIWLEAPAAERRARAVARDGSDTADHWDRWSAAEEAHFAAHHTRTRADVVLSSAGGGYARVARR